MKIKEVLEEGKNKHIKYLIKVFQKIQNSFNNKKYC